VLRPFDFVALYGVGLPTAEGGVERSGERWTRVFSKQIVFVCWRLAGVRKVDAEVAKSSHRSWLGDRTRCPDGRTERSEGRTADLSCPFALVKPGAQNSPLPERQFRSPETRLFSKRIMFLCWRLGRQVAMRSAAAKASIGVVACDESGRSRS